MLADADAKKHMHFASWNSGQRRAWFDALLDPDNRNNTDGMIWGIQRLDSGEMIGYIGIGTSDDPGNALDIDFGYALAPWQWNRGFMTEVFAYQCDVLGVPQLKATCNVPNVGSARVMEKAGMTRTHSDALGRTRTHSDAFGPRPGHRGRLDQAASRPHHAGRVGRAERPSMTASGHAGHRPAGIRHRTRARRDIAALG